MSDSYVASRNIADYTYMFRCQEYQGYLACGTGNTGRGIFQTAALKSIDGIRSVKVSFDFCYQYGSTDLLLFQVVNGGMIASASVDGKSIALDGRQFGLHERLGEIHRRKEPRNSSRRAKRPSRSGTTWRSS